MDRELLNQAAAAIDAPGAVITRESDHEPYSIWQARAVFVVLLREGYPEPTTPLPAFAAIAGLMLMLGLGIGKWLL